MLTATIQDAAGNTVTSDNSTVVAFAKAAGPGTITGIGRDTAIAGIATKTITGELAGSVTMQATAGRPHHRHLGAFTVVHGAAADIAFHGHDGNLTSARAPLTAICRMRQATSSPPTTPPSVAFAKASGAGRHRPRQRDRLERRRDQDDHCRARRLDLDDAHLPRPDRPARSAFWSSTGAADIEFAGPTTNLTAGAHPRTDREVHDAAGNTVTADNTTVVAFAKASGSGTVTGTGNATARAASPPRPSPATSSAP